MRKLKIDQIPKPNCIARITWLLWISPEWQIGASFEWRHMAAMAAVWGGHIRWNTPQDKDSCAFLVAQFSEVNVLIDVLLNCGGIYFLITDFRRHPRRVQSTNSRERTVWVRRILKYPSLNFSISRVQVGLFIEQFWKSSRLVEHWIVQLPYSDNHWLSYFRMR